MLVVRGLTVVVVLAFLVATAHADDEARAAELAKQGRVKTDAGDYQGALELYRQAFALSRAPDHRCNLGAAYYKLGKWYAAHLHLGICIGHTESIGAARVAAYSRAYEFIEKKLKAGSGSQVKISASPPDALITVSYFAPGETFVGPRTVWLPRGEHTVTATADGYRTGSASVALDGRANPDVVVTLEKQPAPAHPEPVKKSDEPPPKDDEIDFIWPGGLLPSPPPPKVSRTGAYVSLSLSGAALIGGIVFHAMAVSTRHELVPLGEGPVRDDKVAELERRRWAMAGFYGASAIAAGVGVYLWWRASRKERALTVGATPTRNRGALVWMTWRR